jgi:flagellar motor switch protein FliN/FliY
MTTPAVPPPGDREAMEWMQTWAQSLSEVLTQIAGAPFAVESTATAPADGLPPAETDLQAVITAAGSLRGEMSLRLSRSSVLGLAQLFLSETQDAAVEFKPEHREAVEELLRQVAGHVATALKPRWGEVHLRLEFGPAPSWSPGVSGWIGSAAGAPFILWLEWQVSAALVAAQRSATSAAIPPEAPAPALTRDPPQAASSEPAPGDKLDMFMDVELGVSLRFGGRSMLLREILELGPGSVVELDRQVQEPVDLLLDGKLIARGEVVVVDGNYGMRVLEVVSAALPG